jgi:hypothetical protein
VPNASADDEIMAEIQQYRPEAGPIICIAEIGGVNLLFLLTLRLKAVRKLV